MEPSFVATVFPPLVSALFILLDMIGVALEMSAFNPLAKSWFFTLLFIAFVSALAPCVIPVCATLFMADVMPEATP